MKTNTRRLALLIAATALTACGGSSAPPAEMPAAEAPEAAPETAQAEATDDPAASEAEPKVAKVHVNDAGLGAQGYDLVAYVSDKKAVEGSAGHSAEHDGVQYRFSSAAHKAEFLASPQKYLPAYGGYCAFAVAAKEAKVPPNPNTFRVQDGRLLLFFNGDYEGKNFDTSKEWDKDTAGMLKKADEKWPTVSEK